MKPKMIYIAGPMTGYENFNFAAFDKARNKLNDEGWTVISPADIDRENGFDALKGDSPELVTKEFMRKAMRADLDALQKVDAIYMLTGWEASLGACAEYGVAKWRSIEIICEKILPPNGERGPMVTSFTLNPTDPKGEAGSKKAPMWLLPPFALEETAWVHGLGSVKYGPWNWVKTKVCASTYISAIMRHLMAWHKRQDNDDESGKSHLAHIAACVNILMDAQHKGCLDDDRL